MASKNVVNKVYQKDEAGLLDSGHAIGATFSDVVDSRSSKGNYSLEQFFDNYLDFMSNSFFVYYGENTPKNNHVALWIDTARTNQTGQ